jgi:SAM-dependent methyltransferase
MNSTFDTVAGTYEQQLAQGLTVTGETPRYFAEGRLQWTAARLKALGFQARRVLDFGCGIGGSVPMIFDVLGAESVLGVDPSAESLAVARSRHGSQRACFVEPNALADHDRVDLAFCNGVFHHIPATPPTERLDALESIHRSLRPGGLFAFWENNPWNPGTRYVMSRLSFDRDAETITPPNARHLLREAGFDVINTDFLFLFPHALRWLRRIEPLLASLPLGAQYLVLARARASC